MNYLPLKNNTMSHLKIGLFGFGCVGSGLYQVLNQNKQLDARIEKIVAKDPTKIRQKTNIPIVFDAKEILDDAEINVVVELINDSHEAYHIVKEALEKGKHVVTANKKLVAERLDELIELAKINNVSLLYEGAVAGSIPIIRNLEEYYNNDTLTQLEGIVNGTTNYILTKANQGISYSEALKEAQEKGFAEADPTLDVDGFDPKYKLAILLKHAFGISVLSENILNIGIKNIKPRDIQYANEKGLRIKLFASARKNENQISAFVAPHFIESTHSAFYVDDEFNAVVVHAAYADKQLFYGKGAGSFPTASAVLSDISALQFNYRYEYRKSTHELLNLTTDFELYVYISATTKEALDLIEFEEIDDLYVSKGFSYKIGKIRFNEIQKINWNDQEDLSLLIFSESSNLILKESDKANSYNFHYN
jgi:homoserine dehydrogenase